MKRASALPLFELQFGVYILPCFLLIHDLELNPGPPRSLGKTNRKVHVTIAHFNVRSMASHEKFYLVKQTIVDYNYDMFVIS